MPDEAQEKLKKMGMLTYTSARAPLFSHIFKSANNSPLCPGYCYVGKYCFAEKGKCNKAHIRSVNELTDATDKAALISWVESQRTVDFAPGKGPTQPGS